MLFMRASDPERRFLAYFFAAVGKEVRRQQANLKTPAQDNGCACSTHPELYQQTNLENSVCDLG